MKCLYEQSQWMFIGSHIPKCAFDNAKKIGERMTVFNRTTVSSYKNKVQDPAVVLLDEECLRATFNNRYKHYVPALCVPTHQLDKPELIAKITEFFNEISQNSLIIFSGPAQEMTGDWVFEFKNKSNEKYQAKIDFEEIHKLWKKRNPSQKHLLLVLDSSYGENWIHKLKLSGDLTISMQTSCKQFEKASEDPKIGSFFLYNWSKIVAGLKFEQILSPTKNLQTPAFYGNFFHCETNFGLQLKFESWNDMRKALNSNHFGDWPRLTKKENPYKKEIDAQDNIIRNSRVDRFKEGIPRGSINFHGLRDNSIICAEEYDKQKEQNQTEEKTLSILNPIVSRKQSSSVEKPNLAQTLIQTSQEENRMDKDIFGISQKLRRENYLDKIKPPPGRDSLAIDSDQLMEMDRPHLQGNNKTYIGDFDSAGKKNGYGCLLDENQNVLFQGQIENDMWHGKGIIYHPSGYKIFEGDFAHHVKNGHGKFFNAERIVVFEGEFANDVKCGHGTEYYDSGKILFDGEYLDDLRHGHGIQYTEDGVQKIKGTWKSGLLHGSEIVIFKESGMLEYKGDYKNGERTGFGRLYYENGNLKYQGQFFNNEINGEGILWDENNQVLNEGWFNHGVFVEKSSEEENDDKIDLPGNFGKANQYESEILNFPVDQNNIFQNEILKNLYKSETFHAETEERDMKANKEVQAGRDSIIHKSRPKFTVPKLEQSQDAFLQNSKIIVPKLTGKNEMINPGNIYQSLKIQSTYNVPLKKNILEETQIINDLNDTIKNGVVIRRKSEIVGAFNSKPRNELKTIQFTGNPNENLTSSKIQKIKNNYGGKIPKQDVSNAKIKTKKMTESYSSQSGDVSSSIFNKGYINLDYHTIKKIHDDEISKLSQLLSKKEIKIKDIKADDIKKNIKNGVLRIEEEKSEPIDFGNLVKTIKAEIIFSELSKNGNASNFLKTQI